MVATVHSAYNCSLGIIVVTTVFCDRSKGIIVSTTNPAVRSTSRAVMKCVLYTCTCMVICDWSWGIVTGKLICDWSWGVCDCLTGHGDRDWSWGLDWSLSPTYILLLLRSVWLQNGSYTRNTASRAESRLSSWVENLPVFNKEPHIRITQMSLGFYEF